MNKGPSLRHIGAYLREQAAQLPERRLTEADEITICVPGTRLRITCGRDQESVLRVAHKYSAGLPASITHTRPKGRSQLRRFSQATLDLFLADGETDNALSYLSLFAGDPRAERARCQLEAAA